MKFIKSYWLILLIVILPILDILNYFFISTKFNSVLSLLRFLIMPAVFIMSILKSKNKKKFILYSVIVGLYCIGHIISCYISGYMNIVEDIENLFRIIYMPTLLFSFLTLLSDKDEEKKCLTGMKIAFLIIILSLILSIVTGNIEYTYENANGISGWFFNKNSQSLILVILSYVCSVYSLKDNHYYPTILIVYALLYMNGTRTSYLSLVILLLILGFYSIVEVKNIKKALFTAILLVLSFTMYSYSPMVNNLNIYTYVQEEKNEAKRDLINIISAPIDNPEGSSNEEEIVEEVKNNKLHAYLTLYNSYDMSELIKKFGLKKVLKKYKYTTDSFILTNVRKKKKIAASLIYDEENIVSHLFGFEFTKIKYLESDESLDLETDFSAIFYYTGFIGCSLYFIFILYYIFKLYKHLFKQPSIIFNSEFCVWLILIGLLLFSMELTGALLRRPNASIYLAIIIAIGFNKLQSNCDKKNINKITFLNLHLGYGGIETATINSANALSQKYDVEIISFYNLKENQTNLINNKVHVKYLYDGEPNRVNWLNSIKNIDVIAFFREGFKAVKILYLRKHLIIEEIKNSNSKFIVSTRYDFSKLLSAYKTSETVAIAQEHHHHNNKRKYINIYKHEYMNIDYLFALTESLKKDYERFLKWNSHTRIIIMPNMIGIPEIPKNKKNNKIIISVGRLAPGKCINELVDIYSKTKNVEKFIIVGDGPEFNNLKEQIANKNMENKIKLLGYLPKDKVVLEYQKSSVFVMASVTEGLPMVLLEAMSYGLPCIAYKTDSGVTDIIDDGLNGYIIKNRDEKEFIKKLDHLISNKEIYNKMSKAALTKAEMFSSKNIMKKWDEIIMSEVDNEWIKKLFQKSYKSTKNSFISQLRKDLETNNRKFVVTANPEAFMLAKDDYEYREMLLDNSTTIVADGIGLIKMGKLLGYTYKERIPGVELVQELLPICNEKKKKIYLFGSKAEVIKKMEKLIKDRYPSITICGAKDGYVEDKDSVFEEIKKAVPDVVLVALGMPMQEKLIYKHLNSFNKGIFIGVGGSFDVISGAKLRAPQLFIKLNLEWLYRLCKEPKRIKRFYNNNIKFLMYIKKIKNRGHK